jgi:hypothetical protein
MKKWCKVFLMKIEYIKGCLNEHKGKLVLGVEGCAMN